MVTNFDFPARSVFNEDLYPRVTNGTLDLVSYSWDGPS